MTAWEDYLKKIGTTRPWDYINPATEFLEKEESDKRLEVCKGCERFSKTHHCKECGCLMKIKVPLKNATCPIGKW